MKNLFKILKTAFICFICLTIVCGVIYPALVTGAAQIFFKDKANGSIITVTLKDGTKAKFGSELIEQEFTKSEYMIGRPMYVSNLSPLSDEQKKLVNERIVWFHSLDPENKKVIPEDLITASGSGVDPNISVESAEYQVQRIARTRNISEDDVRKIIKKYTTGRLLGFWGEPSVNVLKVNLSLDGLI